MRILPFRISATDVAVTCDDAPWVRKLLTLQIREMQVQGRIRQTVYRDMEAFNASSWSDGTPCLLTYPGFWFEIKKMAEQLGYEVAMRDDRRQLPAPDIKSALRGLRAPQASVFMPAVMAEASGLIGAPTRFGKSYLIKAFIKAYPTLRIVVSAPGKDLCRQLYDFLVDELPEIKIHGVWSGGPHKTQARVTVCSVDSLFKMDPDDTDLLLQDEPHACVGDGRLLAISTFQKARRIAFGATLKGRYDKKDRMITGLFGPILSNITYREAVAVGAISPLVVVIRRIPFSKDTVPGKPDRDTVYRRLLKQSVTAAKIISNLCQRVIPDTSQTMVFISDEKQANFLMEKAMNPDTSLAMAKTMTEKVRKALTKLIAAGIKTRVVASRIFVQGVTFPDLRVVVNAEGGGANTTAIQKPGRLLQIRPGKKYGVFVDFLLHCVDEDDDTRSTKPYSGIIGECWARINAYKEIGYDVRFVESDDELTQILEGAYERTE